MRRHFLIPMLHPKDIIPHLGRVGHFVDGYSAAELAKSWWKAGEFPHNVRAVLNKTEGWEGSDVLEAFFERRTDLDTGRAPSQTDLLILANCPRGNGNGIIAVEGKCNEPFGEVVSRWLVSEEASDKPDRLRFLREILSLEEGQVENLRYQLLHRTASAILEAHRFRCSRAVVLVHHFAQTPEENSKSFDDFCLFTKAVDAPIPGRNSSSVGRLFQGVDVRFAWVDDLPEAIK
jgi:hypothetical protein